MTFRRVSVAAIALATAMAAGAAPQMPAPSRAVVASREAIKLPSTPVEHDAMAESYRNKAASYRGEADLHRKMLAESERRLGGPSKSGGSPWLKKIREHCETFIEDAERLAVDADKFADLYKERAAELRGT
jgi:hypothetical protein